MNDTGTFAAVTPVDKSILIASAAVVAPSASRTTICSTFVTRSKSIVPVKPPEPALLALPLLSIRIVSVPALPLIESVASYSTVEAAVCKLTPAITISSPPPPVKLSLLAVI